MHYLWLGTFWAMQATAQLLFAYGSRTPGRGTIGFILGNVFGASSIIFLMILYKAMNPNLALALGSAGGFLCAQGAIALLFRIPLSPLQYIAMVAIAGGMAAFSLGSKGT
jgi:multidrug transporter EmrE-like cation transporter